MHKDSSVLYIKNMVCPRCIKVVHDELLSLGLNVTNVELGSASFKQNLSTETIHAIKERLEMNGFELLEDKKEQLVEQIKLLLVELIQQDQISETNSTISQQITGKIDLDYSYLSKIFSASEGKTIERHTIELKTERIKELIAYGELSIKQIADQLGYSSLQALSSQFKKETGLTPSQYKNQADLLKRKPLDSI